MAKIDNLRAAFKALHQKGKAFVMPNPIDIGTTRILTGMRFDAIATSSAGFAWTRGVQDAEGLISREQALSHAQEIVRATTLPVNGDLENGFGDTPEEVIETIQAAIDVGLAGCSIEDFSQDPKHPFYALDLAVERIKAAVDAKNAIAPDFVLTARSEAPIRSKDDLKQTIDRLAAFAEAGADCVYAPGLREPEDIAAVVSAVHAPLNVLAGQTNFHLTRKELSKLGVARLSIGAGLARIVYDAFTCAAEEIKDAGTFGCFEKIDTVADGAVDFEAFMKAKH